MSTTKCIAENDIKNNGATVMMGGNFDSTAYKAPVTGVGSTIEQLGSPRQEQPGPVYGVGNTYSVRAGDFAKLTEGKYIVKGLHITESLAGVANDTLTSGGTQKEPETIHYKTTRRTVLIDSWNYVTGAPTYNVSNPSNDSFGSDVAAVPTRAIPGYMVHAIGENVPTTTAFEEKTS